VTDSSGVATLEDVDVSGLGAGDHEVTATYSGEDCEFEPTNGLGSIGVNYLFLGFQQPINADGSSKFSGRTIPVKVKLADANGQPVTDADAHIFFALGTPTVVGTDAEPLANTNGDSGNAMRYDASANQYILTWVKGRARIPTPSSSASRRRASNSFVPGWDGNATVPTRCLDSDQRGLAVRVSSSISSAAVSPMAPPRSSAPVTPARSR
jgi:hypothetical protein